MSKREVDSVPGAGPSKRIRTVAAAEPGEGVALIDVNDFQSLNAEIKEFDAQREKVIKTSRDIQKGGKQAIFSLHRGNMKEANTRIEKSEQLARELLPIIAEAPTLREGSYSNALEEWAEAVIFRHFLEHGVLMPKRDIPLINTTEYLGGVLDFTGELNRYCIARATERDVAAVRQCTDLVDGIMGMMLEFDLRNGSIRKKYDALKYTLKKMENTLYELSLTAAGAITKPNGDDAPMETEGGKAEE